MLIDLLALVISVILAGVLREVIYYTYDIKIFYLEDFRRFYWFPVLLLMFFTMEGLYTKRVPFWEQAGEIVKSLTIVMLLAFGMISFFEIAYGFSRSFLVLIWLISIVVFPILRYYGKKFLFRLKIWNEPMLIIGVNDNGRLIASDLDKNLFLGYEVAGFLCHDTDEVGQKIRVNDKEYEVFGFDEDYCQIAKKLDVKVVLIALEGIHPETLARLTADLQQCARRVLIMPSYKGVAMQNTTLLHLFSQQLFLLEVNNNLKKVFNQILNRAFNLSASLMLLPILLPVLAVISIMIRLDSKGPVFFIQSRLGRSDDPFDCYKFRTMYEDPDPLLDEFLKKNPEAAEEYRVYKKLKNFEDPRITKVGRFLRKTSLDELAQILNVLKGEMNLVGPRPYLERERESMGQQNTSIILESNPGITGLWQISGRNDLEFEKRVELDVWYVLNWSIWSDVSILLKTIKVVIKREGAY